MANTQCRCWRTPRNLTFHTYIFPVLLQLGEPNILIISLMMSNDPIEFLQIIYKWFTNSKVKILDKPSSHCNKKCLQNWKLCMKKWRLKIRHLHWFSWEPDGRISKTSDTSHTANIAITQSEMDSENFHI